MLIIYRATARLVKVLAVFSFGLFYLLIVTEVMIHFEREVTNYLSLPAIPKREYDGKMSFDKGVAIVEMHDGSMAYAVCSCNRDKGQAEPVVTKVFSDEPFKCIRKVFVVPNYLTGEQDVVKMDLDEESKKKAKLLLDEAIDKENDGVDDGTVKIESLPEWIIPEITSKEEAEAWLRQYNKRNKIKRGRIPATAENLKLRLFAIYTEQNKKAKG